MRQIEVTKTITYCFQCPYFTIDGGPGGIAYCGHDKFDSYVAVLAWDEVHITIPDFCPFLNNNN